MSEAILCRMFKGWVDPMYRGRFRKTTHEVESGPRLEPGQEQDHCAKYRTGGGRELRVVYLVVDIAPTVCGFENTSVLSTFAE